MEGECNLKITDTEVISHANIELTKVNVLGGVNRSGKSLITKLLYCYLKSHTGESLDDLLESEGLAHVSQENIEFSSDSEIANVLYIENISIMDMIDSDIMEIDHFRHLMECLQAKKDPLSLEVISKIKDLIDTNKYVSSGVKQFNIILTLLENNSLCKNSILILDEPEIGLHPEWKIRYAEILVLLVKELNIKLFFTSYSPIFIESVFLFLHFYEFDEMINYHLAYKQDDGKFNFEKIGVANMGDVYEDLTKPYDELDNIKAELLFME